MDPRRLLTLPLIGLFAVACSAVTPPGAGGIEIGSTPAPSGAPDAIAAVVPGAELLTAGSASFQAGEAGIVTLGRDGTRLAVREVAAEPGWSHRESQRGDDGVEVRFVGPDDAETRLEAELDDPLTLDIDLRERSGATGTRTMSILDAGTVTFTAGGGIVSMDSAVANADAGWGLTEDGGVDDDAFEVDLTNAALLTKVEFNARTDGATLELETELRVGPGYESLDDDDADTADDGAAPTAGPTASPSPTASPTPSASPRPTQRPDATARPTETPDDTETPDATRTPEATDDDDDDDEDNSGPGGGGGGKTDDPGEDDGGGNSGPGGGGSGGGDDH